MLITKGHSVPAGPWSILEVAMNQSPDVLALRLAKELKRIPESPVHIFVPFQANTNGDPSWIVEHVYIRGANGSLSRLARTAGIECVRPEVPEEAWIASLLAHEENSIEQSVTAGAFVRVLTGPCSRMCGTIAAIRGELVKVKIEMRTKIVTAHISTASVQVVECPPENRSFFGDYLLDTG